MGCGVGDGERARRDPGDERVAHSPNEVLALLAGLLDRFFRLNDEEREEAISGVRK